MRSVLVHVRGCSEAELEVILGQLYPGQIDPWLDTVDDDPCLYIRISKPDEAWVPEERAPVLRYFGDAEPMTVVADVSGRHDGTLQVRRLAQALLERFSGVAEDEYSNHLWTLDELRSDAFVDGRRFFDSKNRLGP